MITDRRLQKIENVIANRQKMTVILENVHDKHNIGAIMRTCDSVGIQDIYVVYTDDRIDQEHFEAGKTSASSARKWLNTFFFDNLESCIKEVRKNYENIFATHLGKTSKSLYDLDLTSTIAFMFGNEKDGISEEAMKYVDANLIIPQVGMIESLNISVACAITLYEAKRQRILDGQYGNEYIERDDRHSDMMDHFMSVNNQRYER